MNTPQPNDGGPAIPVPDVYHPNGQIQFGSNGMTLRDWFAGQALANSKVEDHNGPRWADYAAAQAYQIADAMLAARVKTNTPAQ